MILYVDVYGKVLSLLVVVVQDLDLTGLNLQKNVSLTPRIPHLER